MLTIKQITENKEGVIKGLEKKLFKDARKNIDAVLAQNDCRREAQGRLDATLQLINAKSKEIGTLMRDGKRDEAEAAKAFVSARKEEAKAIEAEMDNAAAAMKALLLNIPNVPYDEVPVTNIYRDEILREDDLPVKNCAYTECFRREAGSYGKDVRGLNRLHEFSKVELVRIDTPEHSRQSHKEMLDHVEGLLQKLELPYRILRLCGGDISFTAALCFDFEVYSEAQKRWLEVSSVSNFDTYQANRLHCRYRRNADKKIELCHTLNGSALALPRIVAALLENNQTPQGIRIPKALVPYTGFDMID